MWEISSNCHLGLKLFGIVFGGYYSDLSKQTWYDDLARRFERVWKWGNYPELQYHLFECKNVDEPWDFGLITWFLDKPIFRVENSNFTGASTNFPELSCDISQEWWLIVQNSDWQEVKTRTAMEYCLKLGTETQWDMNVTAVMSTLDS